MLTRDDAGRIADAIHALRPDWSHASLMAVLGDQRLRMRRIPRDAAVAFVALAMDPDTKKPTRIFDDGPWWACVAPLRSSGPVYRKPEPDDCHHCHRPAHANIPGDHDYLAAKAFRPQPTPMPESVRSLLVRPAARTPKPETPKRPVDDILADHTTQEN
jgi:hypothetical protein